MFRMMQAVVAFFLASASHADTGGSDMTSHTFKTISGDTLALSDLKGKAVLVVNTASRCGFTKQYEGLQSLWERYRDKGLVVLAVPSNDFGGQEPLSEGEIKTFCEVNYNIDFPITEKAHVKGSDAHPFYKEASEHFGFSGSPKWNFHKYLINADGSLVDWFSSITTPDSDKLLDAIEQALPANKPVLEEQRSLQALKTSAEQQSAKK